jgi:hypothetical protein
MKHILILTSLLLLVNTQMKGQCQQPSDATDHVFKQLIIHGTHDNIFWSGDTLNILLEEIDHVRYDTIDHVPIYYNDQDFDAYVQCRLDSGATPQQLINEYDNPESVIHHLYGKTYEGALIFSLNVSGGGLVADISDAPSQLNWNAAMSYCDTLSTGGVNDWYLPNRNELNQMYKNLHKKGLGGFSSSNYNYWSSSEIFTTNFVWLHNFYFGHQSGGNNKFNTYSVRAIRAF